MTKADNLMSTNIGASAEKNLVSVRPLTPDTIASVVGIHHDAFLATPSFTKRLGRNFSNKTYTWFCDGPERYGYVAYVGGTAAGFIVGSSFVPFQKLNDYRFVTGILSLACRPHLIFSHLYNGGLLKAKLAGPQIDFNLLGDKFGFVYSIAVRSAFQNMKIGRLLMSTFAEGARDQGKEKVVIPVGKTNESSLALCRSLDYIPEPRIKDQENIYLVKVL